MNAAFPAHVLEQIPGDVAPAPTQKKFPQTIDIKKCFSTTPPALDFVLPGFLAGTVGGLVSPGGVGKSFFALQAAITIAAAVAGADMLGLGAKKAGKVMIFAGEDPGVALHHRLHAMGEHINPAQREAAIAQMEISECLGYGVDLNDDEWAEWMARMMKGCRLAIIDTLTRFHSLDENKAEDAKRIMSRLEMMARDTGASILFLHHVNKAAAMNGLANVQQAARGSSVFVDNARWLSFIAGMNPEEAKEAGIPEADRWRYARWNINKQNYSAGGDDYWYQREEGGVLVPVAMDEIGLAGEVKKAGVRKAASEYAVASGGDDDDEIWR